MITIIKPAKDLFTHHCTYCGCTWQYQLEDVFDRFGQDSIECPKCRRVYLHFDPEELPYNARHPSTTTFTEMYNDT